MATGLSLVVAELGTEQRPKRELAEISWKLPRGWQGVLHPSVKPEGQGAKLRLEFEPEVAHGAVFDYKVGQDGRLYFSATDFWRKEGEPLFSGYVIVEPSSLAVSLDGQTPAQFSRRVTGWSKSGGAISFLLQRQARRWM